MDTQNNINWHTITVSMNNIREFEYCGMWISPVGQQWLGEDELNWVQFLLCPARGGSQLKSGEQLCI